MPDFSHCSEQTLERIAKEYGSQMLKTGYLYLKNFSAAEDAVQDSLLKIYLKWPGFENAVSEKTWVMRVLVNTCRDALQSAWRSRVVLTENISESLCLQPFPSEESALSSAMICLSQKNREAVLLFYYIGFSQKEIAAMLHIRPSAVGMRLNRARKQLYQTLNAVHSFLTL